MKRHITILLLVLLIGTQFVALFSQADGEFGFIPTYNYSEGGGEFGGPKPSWDVPVFTSGGYKYFIENAGATIISANPPIDSDTLVIPFSIDGHPVLAISGFNIGGRYTGAFCGVPAQRIVLPDGLRYIGKYAFAGCKELEAVDFGKSIEFVGYAAFINCNRLKSVSIHNLAKWCSVDFENETANPLFTAQELYYNGELVTDVIVPKEADRIGRCTFVAYKQLRSIVLHDNVLSIGNSAFRNCKNLEVAQITDSVLEIGAYAFNSCEKLQKLHLPKNITTFDEENYDIRTPTDVSTSSYHIGYAAFQNCESLISVDLPTDLRNVGSEAFYGCNSLEHVWIPSGVEYINARAFYKCSNLKTVHLPETLALIGGDVFRDCKALTNICLPDSLTYIGSGAFYGCNRINNFYIGKQVAKIGNDAFNSCASLERIRYGGTREQWLDISFGNNDRLFECNVEYLSECQSFGDSNCDGITDASDALLTLLVSVGKKDLSVDFLVACDLNLDQFVNSKDALIVLKIAVGKYN